jgi:hypothetical protein
VLFVVLLAFLPRVRRDMTDFEVDWRTGARWAAAEPLYRVEDGHYQYKYLPIFGAVMAPLSKLPLGTAKTAWFFVVITSIAASLTVSLLLIPNPRRSTTFLALATTITMAKFFAREADLGQFNAVVLLAVLGGLSFIDQDHPVLAGLAFTAAVVTKPYAVVFLPYLAVKGRLKSAVVFATALLIALLIPSRVYGWTGNIDLLRAWIRTVSDSTAPNLLNQDNVSVASMYARWIGTGIAASWLAVVTLAALAMMFAEVLRRGRELAHGEYLEVAMLLALIPLASPQGWDYVLLLATPAVMLVVDRLALMPASLRALALAALAIIAFSIFDVMGRRAYAEFMSFSTISICALVVVGSLAYLRFRQFA